MHSFFVEYIAGVCGGVAVVCVGHPFDTIKTRLQTAPPGFYVSTLDCLKKTWKKGKEALLDFPQNFTYALFAIMPYLTLCRIISCSCWGYRGVSGLLCRLYESIMRTNVLPSSQFCHLSYGNGNNKSTRIRTTYFL